MGKSSSNPFARYTRADQPCKPRIIAGSFGEAGSGKTHFWMGAPAPIVVHSFDKGLEGVVEKFQDEKEIYFVSHDWSPTDEISQDEAKEIRDKFIEDYKHSLTVARTVVIDRETDMWEVYRYAEFGSPNDSPKDYDALNKRYRWLVNAAKATDVNLGMLQGMKDIWSSKMNPNTGKVGLGGRTHRERAGMRELESLVHVNIEHAREEGQFLIRVGKSRGPGSNVVQDETFSNLTFAEFGQMLFPDSSENDWL